jgi:hypothetical protein
VSYLDNSGLFAAMRRPRSGGIVPPSGRTYDTGTTSGPYSCPIPVPFGCHYDSEARLMWRYDFDGVGLFDPEDIDAFIARTQTTMSDSLHELDWLDEHLDDVYGGTKRPTPPTRLWPAWPIPLYQWRMRKYVQRWFSPGQAVRIEAHAFKGRAGVITELHPQKGGYTWSIVVRLYGGVVGHPDYITAVSVAGLRWLTDDEAVSAEAADRAMIAQAAADIGPTRPATPAGVCETHDAILHPRRRLTI